MRLIEYHAMRTRGGNAHKIQELLIVSPNGSEHSDCKPGCYDIGKYALVTHGILGKPQIGLDVVAKKFSLPLSGTKYCNLVHIYWKHTIKEIENLLGSVNGYNSHPRIFTRTQNSSSLKMWVRLFMVY
jgi:hypothetical protein